MARPPRPNPLAQDVKAASEHLHYEIAMFEETAELLKQEAFPEGAMRNAVLEAFTLHARSLSQFFFPETGLKKDTDVMVWDYVDRAKWEHEVGSTLPAGLTDINTRVGTEIAHLSYGRVWKLPNTWNWNIASITAAMAPLVDEFKRLAPPHLLGPKWSQSLGMTAFRPGYPPAVVGTTGATATSTSPTWSSTDISSKAINKLVGGS